MKPWYQETPLQGSTYGWLMLGFILDIVLGVLLGFTVGVFTCLLSRVTNKDKSCQYFEPAIAVSGTFLVYFVASSFTLSPLFSVLTCCLLHQRFLFDNFHIISIMAVEDGMETLAKVLEGIFFIIIGYFLVEVNFTDLWQPVLLFLVVSYAVKAFIILCITVLLNMRNENSAKKVLETVAVLVFAGSRGPRCWLLLITLRKGTHKNLTYFRQFLLLLITFTVVLDTLISRTIYNKLEECSEEEEEEEVLRRKPSRLVKWMEYLENQLSHLLVAKEDEESRPKKEMEMAMAIWKLEQHSFHQSF